MRDGTIPVEMQDKYLGIIAYEADRLEKLTQGLLTLNELDIHKRLLISRTLILTTPSKRLPQPMKATVPDVISFWS